MSAWMWNHINPIEIYRTKIKKIDGENNIFVEWAVTHRHSGLFGRNRYISLYYKYNDNDFEQFLSLFDKDVTHKELKGSTLRHFIKYGVQERYMNSICKIEPRDIYKMNIYQTYLTKHKYNILVINLLDTNKDMKITTRMNLNSEELDKFRYNLHTNEYFSRSSDTNRGKKHYKFIVDGNFLINNLITFGMIDEGE